LETLTTADITAETFDEELHPKNQLQSNSLIDLGDNAYKLITEENWSAVIMVDQERYEQLTDGDYIKVKFLKTGDVSWGQINLFENDGNYFCKLDFTNSMITFATDRYLDIELDLSPQRGLKIPNSAIVEREFYLIPKKYLIAGGPDGEDGFMRETYLEDGSKSTEFIGGQIYYSTDDEYYVDTAVFRLGDYILPGDSGDSFAIGKKENGTNSFPLLRRTNPDGFDLSKPSIPSRDIARTE